MGKCCGGKNAGLPISKRRYLAGLGVFLGYHSTVAAALHTLAVPFPELRRVRDFHRKVYLTELGEVLRREDININGQLPDDNSEQICEVVPLDPSQGVAA